MGGNEIILQEQGDILSSHTSKSSSARTIFSFMPTVTTYIYIFFFAEKIRHSAAHTIKS